MYYGGIEKIAWDLANGLANKGHEVTLVGAQGSVKPEKAKELIETINPVTEGLLEDKALSFYTDRLKEFDIVHDHTHFKALSYYLNHEENKKAAGNLKSILTTHTTLYSTVPQEKPNMVALSKSHADLLMAKSSFKFKYVYNGIDVNTMPFFNKKTKTDRFIFVGRLTPDKGGLRAIQYCKKLDVPLDVVGGRLWEWGDEYAVKVAQACRYQSKWVFHGELLESDRNILMGRAKAFLFPLEWCIEPTQLILTQEGYKQIKDITTNDKVITSDGDFKQVLRTFVKEYNGNIQVTYPCNTLPFKSSPEHMILVKEEHGRQWKHASALKRGDLVGLPILQESHYLSEISEPYTYTKMVSTGKTWIKTVNSAIFHMKLTPETLFTLGAYVAEGSALSKKGGLCFSFGKKDYDTGFVEQVSKGISQINLHWQLGIKENRVDLRVSTSWIYQIFSRWFGIGAKNKHLPQWIMALDATQLMSFLQGLFRGDGYTNTKNISLASASKSLILQIQMLILRYRIRSSIIEKTQSPKSYSSGRSKIYSLRICQEDMHKTNWIFNTTFTKSTGKWSNGRQGRIEDNIYWTPIWRTESVPYSGKLYDFHVGANNSYLVHNIIVHNSEPFGLTVVEAMAAGTPVIAYRKGSMSELIEHEKTGFLADDEDDFLGYMKRVDEIDPVYCRKVALEKFNVDRMITDYEKLYQEIMNGEDW